MADADSKRCTSCNAVKVLAEFHRNPITADGRCGRCKDCISAIRKAAYTPERAATNLARVLAWQQTNPAKVAAKRSEWAQANPEKMRASRKAWKRANPDKVRADASMRARANPEKRAALENVRRSRKTGAGGKFTAKQISRLHVLQQGKCAICAAKLGKRFHRDHIKPVVRGGSSDITNIQLLCQRCNCRKGPKDPIEHAQQLGRLL